MQPKKYPLLFFLLLCVSVSFAQKAGFTATIGVNTYTVKNGDVLHVCKGGNITYATTAIGYNNLTWRYTNGGLPVTNSLAAFSVNYADTGKSFYTVQKVGFFDKPDDSIKVTVIVAEKDPNLKAGFSFLPVSTACANTNFSFDASVLSAGRGLTYYWDFGDGIKGSGAKINHSFNTAIGSSGTQDFSVKLTVTNSDGCNEEITKTVTVTKIPDASLGNDPSNAELTTFNGLGTFRKCLKLDSYTFTFVNKSTTTLTNSYYRIIWGDNSNDFESANWALNAAEQHLFLLGNSVITFQVTNSITGCVTEKKYNVFIGSNSEGSISLSSNTGNAGCVGQTLEFPLSNYENNPPGTIYYVYVNDGFPFPNPIDSFQHPPPATYKHTFTSTSCGKFYETYNNSLYVKLIAENACNLFPAGNSAYPIYISDTPRAKLNADTIACVNTSIPFSDISFYGSVINPSSNQLECNSTGKRLWKVLPAANVTVSPANGLGSYNGNFLDWDNWVSGSVSPSFNFSAAGTYTVKLYISNNNSCKKIDSTEITICVREIPKADIVFNPQDSCNASTVQFKAAMQNSCNGNSYTWTVIPSDASNCSASNTYNFISPAADSAIIQFTGAGKYNVILNAGAKGAASCPVAKDTTIVTIKARPVVDINSISSICAGNSIAPTAKVTDCYTGETLKYEWEFPGASITTSALENPVNIIYNSTGIKTVTLKVTNSCGTTTATIQFEVIENPNAKAGADIVMCSGELKNIGENTELYNYDWLPKTGLSNYNTARPLITHINNGTANDTLTYFLTASGGVNCKDYDTVMVVIKPSPVVNVDPLSKTICKGSTIILTASGAGTYTWSPDLYLSSATGSIVMATPPASQTFTVKGSLSNNCSNTAQAIITVVDNPVANAGNDLVTCSGITSIIGSNTNAGNNYQWSPTNGLNNPAAEQTAITVYNNNEKNDTLTYYLTVTAGICNNTDAVQVVVKKSPSVTVSPANTAICENNSTILTANGADSYIWSPQNYLNSATTASVVSQPAASITYTVTGTLLNGCFADTTVTVTVNPDAKAAFTPDNIYSNCAGYNLNEVINITAYPDRNAEYKWYKNGILFYTSTLPIAPNYLMDKADDSVVIQMIASSLYNCKSDTTRPVIFKTGAGIKAQFIKNDLGGCEPRNVLFINTSSVLDNSSNFSWTFGNGINSNSIQPGSILYNTGTQSRDTMYYITLKAANSCAIDSLKDSIYILAKPVARFGTSDSTSGCSPYSIKFTNTSAGNPTGYYWDFGDGFSFSTSEDTAVSYTYNSLVLDTFIVKLAAINGCGTDTLELPLVIAPNSIAAQVSIYGNNLYGCAPFTVNFINNTTGALKSLWTYGDGRGEELPGNIRNVSHTYNDTGTYNISVSFDNGCSKAVYTQQITAYSKPEAAFSLINTSNIICDGDSVKINITKQTGDFNKLYWGDDNLFYSPPVTSHFYNNTGSYLVQLIANRINNIGTVCADTAVQLIKIAERPQTTVSKDNDINCISGSTYLHATGGAYYLWMPDTTLSNARINNPLAQPLVSKFYHVAITAASGCIVHDSVFVKVDFSNADNGFPVASAFTPNGDGLNDLFGIKYWGVVTDFDFKVFDRRGDILFATTDPFKKWDGAFKGTMQTRGTYVYQIRAKTNCGTVYRKGTVVLIR